MNMKSKMLLGAIAGDVIGSVYEFHSVKSVDFQLFNEYSRFTDDTVMTMAHFDWLLNGGDLSRVMQRYGRRYRHRGYGGMFGKWIWAENPQPYKSYGNGSAMRVTECRNYAQPSGRNKRSSSRNRFYLLSTHR